LSYRQPVADKTRRFQPATTVFPLPSPTGGWNARDNLAKMPPLDAITMDNFKATTGGVSLRRGNTLYADGVTGQVETLFEYESASAGAFLACSGVKIYTITGGTVTDVGGTYTNARWQTTMFNGVGFFANGSDTPVEWDGSTLSNTLWTGSGLTEANLINVSVSRSRLWFVEKDTGFAWYGGPGAVTGTLLKFDIGQICRAGYLMAVGTWSRDSGDGQDDLTVFVMSNGQIAVYENDVAANFTLIGVYEASEPIGRRCLMNIGGELIIITKGGYAPLSSIMKGAFGPDNTLSDKIRGAVSDATAAGSTLFGWQGVNHPDGIHVLFNVPNSTTDFDQHVFNNITGAWSRYKDWDGSVFGVYGGDMYMGVLDQVYKLDQGGIDESNTDEMWEDISEQWETNGGVWETGGLSVSGTCVQASNSVDNPQQPLSGRRKQVTMARPYVKGGGDISITLDMLPDFKTATPTTNLQVLNPGGAASSSGVASKNISAMAEGETFSVALTVETSEDIEWYLTDIFWRPGGLL